MAAYRLLVKFDFGSYRAGDRITDPDTIREVEASHPDHILREPVVPAPKAEPKPAEAKPAAPAPKGDAKGD